MVLRNSIIKKTLKAVMWSSGALFLLLSTPCSFAQQNIQFSQYIFNTISINPAYAGFKEDWYFQAAHRQQWMGIEWAPVTTQLSIDGVTDVLSKNVGLGLQITSDRLGAQSATSIYANYAYRIKLDYADMSRLSFGLAVGLTQYSTDVSQLIAINPEDPYVNFETSSSYIPDVRFGIYYYNPKFYVGLSVMDLLSGKDSTSVLNWKTDSTCNVIRQPHLYLMGGALVELSDYIKLRPSVLIREDFQGPTNIDLSALFVFDNRFWVGGTYRSGYQLWKNYPVGQLSIPNALIGIVNFQVTDQFRIGYSYDYALNSLSGMQNGTHELTIGWLLSRRSKRVLSPRFF